MGECREISLAYHGQSHAEAALRQRQDVAHWTVRPHLTTASAGVRPPFLCLLASRWCQLIERACRALGYHGSVSRRCWHCSAASASHCWYSRRAPGVAPPLHMDAGGECAGSQVALRPLSPPAHPLLCIRRL